MDNSLLTVRVHLFCFQPQAPVPQRTSSHDITNDVELPLALRSEREPLGCVLKELRSGLRYWIGIPVMGLLGATDYRTTV
jgi:hypothetical protein